MKKIMTSLRSNFFTKLFLRFMIGGAAGFALSWIITFVYTELFKQNYFWVYAAALVVAYVFNFVVAMLFIYRRNDQYRRRFFKYLITAFVFYLANLGLVTFSVEKLNVHHLIAIPLVTAFLFVAKFLIYTRFVFEKNDQSKSS